jgi:transcriptional regulator with XRE-family HTH domain
MKKSRLAALLHEVRSDKGVSLREAARRADIDPAYLSRLEHGRKSASAAVLGRLASLYDVDPDVVLLADGRVPDDIVDILRDNPEVVSELRVKYGKPR